MDALSSLFYYISVVVSRYQPTKRAYWVNDKDDNLLTTVLHLHSCLHISYRESTQNQWISVKTWDLIEETRFLSFGPIDSDNSVYGQAID